MKALVFDFETTNIDRGSPLVRENRVVMVAWQRLWDGGEVEDYYGDVLEAGAFWAAVEEADTLIAHAGKFESGWLLRLGFDPSERAWWDTLLAERVIAGNRKWPLDLGSVSKRYGFAGKEDRVARLLKMGVCPSLIDPRYLRARCRRDVRTTGQVYHLQRERVADMELGHLVQTRCMLMPVLAIVEREGMCLDPERVEAEYAQTATKEADLRARLAELTGGINLRSGKQKAAFFYDTLGLPEPVDAKGVPKRTAKGERATDKATLAWLERAAKTPEQKEFFALVKEHAKASALLSKNLEFFVGVVREQGGIFHGDFTQHITATHRLSGRGRPRTFSLFPKPKSVQFQNMPREYKRLFRARDPDYLMVEVDGSQLEFRVAAFVGHDAQAKRDILDPDFDAHVTSAAVMAERPYREMLEAYRRGDKDAKTLRTAAKAETFKPLFGGTKGTEAQERWYTEFRRRYAGIAGTQKAWLDEVIASGGELRTEWGMRFYWDFTTEVRRDGTIFARDTVTKKPIRTSVSNYPIQSLATAEIIPIAFVALFRRCKRQGIRVRWVNSVHDSVVAEVHGDDVGAYIEACKVAFTTDVVRYLKKVYALSFDVPLGCEVKYGPHWGEGEEVKHDAVPASSTCTYGEGK